MQGRLQSQHRLILEPLGFKFEREDKLTSHAKCNHNKGKPYNYPMKQCVVCNEDIRCKSEEGCDKVQLRYDDVDLCRDHFIKENGNTSAEIEAGKMIHSMVNELNTANKNENIELIIKQQVAFGSIVEGNLRYADWMIYVYVKDVLVFVIWIEGDELEHRFYEPADETTKAAFIASKLKKPVLGVRINLGENRKFLDAKGKASVKTALDSIQRHVKSGDVQKNCIEYHGYSKNNRNLLHACLTKEKDPSYNFTISKI